MTTKYSKQGKSSKSVNGKYEFKRCTSKNMTNQIPNDNRLFAKNLWKNIVVVLFPVMLRYKYIIEKLL